MGNDFEASFVKMSRSQKNATREALQMAQAWGKDSDEIKLLTLAARGAAPEALEKLRVAMERSRKEMAASGMSAKQYAAAMRGVPAQLTDIVTSLQGG